METNTIETNGISSKFKSYQFKGKKGKVKTMYRLKIFQKNGGPNIIKQSNRSVF